MLSNVTNAVICLTPMSGSRVKDKTVTSNEHSSHSFTQSTNRSCNKTSQAGISLTLNSQQ